MITMERAQLMLEPVHTQFLADEAAREGVSMSELVRRWIGEKMEASAKTSGSDSGDALIGLGDAGPGRVSETHDEELARIRRSRSRPLARAMAANR